FGRTSLSKRAIDLSANGCEGRLLQNLRDRVADLAHDDRRSARFHVNTLVTLAELCLACTGKRCQRAFDEPDHVGQRNLLWWFSKIITATLSPLAENETAPFQR